MFKQRSGKMRPTVWLLTIVPLIVLCIATFVTAAVAAAFRPTVVRAADTVAELVTADRVAAHKSVQQQYTDAAMFIVALQATVTTTTQTTVTPTPQPIVLPRLTPTITPTIEISTSTLLSDTNLSESSVITSSTPATVTSAMTVGVVVGTEESGVDAQVLDEEYAGPIEGTIIANRTQVNVRFFVEGATYELAPLRSVGLTLPRVTAVLNLFNCDAALPETQEGCFWDPYPLDRDGFYEIVTGGDAGSATGLTLQAAGTPPGNQVWVQNRTGQREQIFYAGETYDLPPSVVQTFTTDSGAPAIFYLRSCVEGSDRTVCEWTPQDADPGFYYALIEETTTGAVSDSRVNTIQLQVLFPWEGENETSTPEAPLSIVCRLQVPTLNVRSGPGLQYQIISKVRSTEAEPATLRVIGRDVDGQWLAVDDQIAPGGWVAGSSGFVSCDGEITILPTVEPTDGRLAPTPIPAPPSAPVEDTTTEAGGDQQTTIDAAPAETPVEVPTEAPTVPAAPVVAEGQALIVIHNGFEQVIRFTLDQKFRVEIGPSEYDLLPGESISLLVYPGMVAFSASTPWRGLSGNDDFMIEAKQVVDLWITFVPDPDGSGRWLLQF